MKFLRTADKGNQAGYVLVGVLVLVGLAGIVSIGMLDSAKATAKTRAIVKTRSTYYYEVEQTLNSVVTWLQDNSKNLVGGFLKADFEANYDFGVPSNGDNEGEHFQTPTLVKVKGTSDTPMLSNNAFFGTSNFPNTKNIDSGASFDPVASFQAANIGPANARLVMVWAQETADSYRPIFRIDVLTGNNPDRGVHSFSYVYSKLNNGGFVPGFFGKTKFETGSANNECYSFLWEHNGTTWTKGAARGNCTVGSDGTVSLKSKVNGTASSLQDDGIELLPPGGQATEYCEGSGCHSVSLPDPGTWAANCPPTAPSATIASNTTYASGACYQNITINNNRKLRLTDTSNPYWFKSIDFKGNFSNLEFPTIPPDEKIQIYVETIVGGHLNGNRKTNVGVNAPHQVEIIYIGTAPLTLNGTADLGAIIIAPYAKVNMLGTFTMDGGVLAQELSISGNAKMNFTENFGATPAVSDMSFTLRKASQRYR